ncbi:hypothetical protein C8J56DRAFT_390238 [Mycena floridula]|nr:hypothetical protein C8J56DRAFT_390238 [Mycena floridula]
MDQMAQKISQGLSPIPQSSLRQHAPPCRCPTLLWISLYLFLSSYSLNRSSPKDCQSYDYSLNRSSPKDCQSYEPLSSFYADFLCLAVFVSVSLNQTLPQDSDFLEASRPSYQTSIQIANALREKGETRKEDWFTENKQNLETEGTRLSWSRYANVFSLAAFG